MTFTQGYPTTANCKVYISDVHVETVEEHNADYWTQWLQMHWRMLNMHESASALNVYAATSDSYNVAKGKFYWGGEDSDFAGGTAHTPVDDDITYVWIEPGNVISDALVGVGWPDDKEHVKLAEVTMASGVITDIVDRRPMLAIPTGSTKSGITTGMVHCKRIATAELELLLDTGTNNLFAVKGGDLILQIVFCTETAAGAVCTVDIGFDVTAAVGAADTNGWIEAADANAAGQYSTTDDTYDGTYVEEGGTIVAADGNVTITSSNDRSASAFVGGCYMLYIPGQ